MMSLEFAVLSAVAALNQQGLEAAAIELADLSLQDEPDQGRLWEAKGVIHSNLGQLKDARESLETANCLVPLRPEGRFALAECYSVAGHVDLAKDLFVSLLDWEEVSNDLLLKVARCLDWLGRSELAVQACRTVLSRDSGDSRAYYEMAFYLRRSNSPTHLIESVARHAVRLDHKNISYRIALALFLEAENRSFEASESISDFSLKEIQAIRCACCLKKMAEIYSRSGDRERADLCVVQMSNVPAAPKNSHSLQPPVQVSKPIELFEASSSQNRIRTWKPRQRGGRHEPL